SACLSGDLNPWGDVPGWHETAPLALTRYASVKRKGEGERSFKRATPVGSNPSSESCPLCQRGEARSSRQPCEKLKRASVLCGLITSFVLPFFPNWQLRIRAMARKCAYPDAGNSSAKSINRFLLQ